MSSVKYADETQTLIASLDILGVKQIMINASPEELSGIAKKINTAFTGATTMLKKAVEFVSKTKQSESLTRARCICDKMIRHTFSDTIVISLALKDIEPEQRELAIKMFLFQCIVITHEMFFAGYPIRGCVDYGEVYQENNIVVGAPYVKSLITAECLQFSGVVVTAAAYALCRPALSPTSMIHMIPDHCVQTKEGATKMHCLNWLMRGKKSGRDDVFFGGADWRQVLYERFAANGKPIDESVWPKLVNTENVLRAFINQIHNHEQKGNAN